MLAKSYLAIISSSFQLPSSYQNHVAKGQYYIQDSK